MEGSTEIEMNRVLTRENAVLASADLRSRKIVSAWLVYPALPDSKRGERWVSVAILPDGWKVISHHGSATKAQAAAKAALEHGLRPLPQREPDGEFKCFQTWVNKATSWIGGTNALCADALGRRCRIGGDFMRARDEGAFPVRYWHDEGHQTVAEQRRSRTATRQIIGDFKFRMREALRGG